MGKILGNKTIPMYIIINIYLWIIRINEKKKPGKPEKIELGLGDWSVGVGG